MTNDSYKDKVIIASGLHLHKYNDMLTLSTFEWSSIYRDLKIDKEVYLADIFLKFISLTKTFFLRFSGNQTELMVLGAACASRFAIVGVYNCQIVFLSLQIFRNLN